jgi:secretion/DNA translocation related TadE-like protein
VSTRRATREHLRALAGAVTDRIGSCRAAGGSRLVPGLRRRHNEHGSATVAAVGVMAVLLLLTVSVLTLSSAIVASHRARSAADLASLAGASALMRGEPLGAACARAAAVARLGGAVMISCTAVGAETLAVRGEVRPTLPVLGPAVASARAGPAPRGSQEGP